MFKFMKVIIDILTIADDEKALKSAVLDYITTKKVIKDLEDQLDAQKSIIMEYARVSGIHGIKFMNNVIDYIPETKYTQVNKDKFKLNLINAGVDAHIIHNCETAASEEKGRAGYLKLRSLEESPKK